MKIDKIASVIIVIMLSSCSSVNEPTATLVIQPSIEVNTTLPSPAPTTTPSATKNAGVNLPEGCINLRSTPLDPSAIEGLLITMDWSNFWDAEYLFDPQTRQKIDMVDDGQQSFNTYLASPNKENMLASISTRDGESYYVFKTPNKVNKINVPIPEDWIFSWWSDNEHMIFYTLEPNEYLNSWNPFTGEIKRIQLDLPNAIDKYFAPGLNIVKAYSDSTLERVFYVGKDGRLILWNLEAKKEIASLPKPVQEEESSVKTFLPVFGEWSPEGKKLVTSWPIRSSNIKSPANELYVFDMDGKISQLTELNQKYPFANVEDPVWSPDGSQIGFWLKIGDSNSNPLNLHQWLAVLDTNDQEAKIYCLANDNTETQAWHIIWSPSSQQLIANINMPNGKFSPILVDLVNQTQSELSLPDMGVIDPNMLVEDWIVR